MLWRYPAVTTDFFSCEMKFSMELARSCCRPKQRPLLSSILQSFICLWVKIWHRNKTASSKLNPVQSSRSKSTTCPRKGVCSDSNQTAQQLQMAARKSLETMFGMILNWSQPKFAAKLVANELWPVLGGGSAQIPIEQHTEHRDFRWRSAKAWKRCLALFWINSNQSLQPNQLQMKCYVWKPCSDQRWQDKLQFSISRFFELSDLVNNHLLCYWPTNHNLISKICPEFQVISSHFFKVNKLLDKHWQKLCKVKKTPMMSPIYVKCNKMYQS